jgi:hypothetical protein
MSVHFCEVEEFSGCPQTLICRSLKSTPYLELVVFLGGLYAKTIEYYTNLPPPELQDARGASVAKSLSMKLLDL